ncbi:hypothetical protein C1I95_30905 [Micromonospora craterilacus]|uniref:Uncharacterized protein n=2 Tax=Micromonospora craterilacus TaxID=1655439 RepID=A0A2W2E1Z3_9ACTN|nr:hypothetical protein C1I95_30905 [Micromonospora craterilacus]
MAVFWLVALTASCVIGIAGGSDIDWLLGLAVVWAAFALPMSLSAWRGAKEFNTRWVSTTDR